MYSLSHIQKLQIILKKMRFLLLIMGLPFVFGCVKTPDQKVIETPPTIQLTVDNLLKELNRNTTHYKEKVITVHGIVDDVNFLNKRSTVLLKSGTHSDTLILCDMQKSQIVHLNNVQKGQTISIKGIFKGALKDVIFLNCIISN